MDPASIIGLTSSSIALLKTLGHGVLSVKALLHGIRDVDEATQGFGEELDAFHFSLTVFDFEIRNQSMAPELQRWWGVEKLVVLVTNATKTFSRLEAIFCDINRHRSILRKPRQYITTNQYGREITHLRLRINTYTLAFNIPVVLLAIHHNRDSNSHPSESLNLSLLGEKLSQLERSITKISDDIRAIGSGMGGSPSTSFPQPRNLSCQDSVDLVEVARTLSLSASSVAASEMMKSTQSTSSTTKRFDPEISPGDDTTAPPTNPVKDGDGVSPSITGVPLTQHQRSNIESWILKPKPRTTTYPFGDDVLSVADLSVSFVGTSSSSEIIMTPPQSTVATQDDDDIEVELFKRRYNKAKSLMDSRKYQEAIPHLKRTLETIKDLEDSLAFREARLEEKVHFLLATALIEQAKSIMVMGPFETIPRLKRILETAENFEDSAAFQEARPKQKIQFLLATAFSEQESTFGEAEAILQEVLSSMTSKQLEKFSAAHLLASISLARYPNDHKTAKELCLTAVKGRRTTLGRTHPDTYGSISLLISICQKFNDSDAEIWRDFLPENFENGISSKVYKGGGNPERDNIPCAYSNFMDFRVTLGESDYVRNIAFTPDRKHLVLLLWRPPNYVIESYDFTTGKMDQQSEPSSLPGLPPCTDTQLPAWFLLDTELRHSIVQHRLSQASKLRNCHLDGLYTTCEGMRDFFSPNGRWEVSTNSDRGDLITATVYDWDADTVITFDVTTPKTHSFRCKFSPDSKLLAILEVDNCVIWDMESRSLRQDILFGDVIRGKWNQPRDQPRDLAFSTDSKYLATLVGWTVIGLWDVATGRLLHKLRLAERGTGEYFNRVAFSPNGKITASTRRSHYTGSKSEVPTFAEVLDRVAFSPNGKIIASTRRSHYTGSKSEVPTFAEVLDLWDTTTGTILQSIQLDELPTSGESLNFSNIYFSPGGDMIAGYSLKGKVMIWKRKR